MENNKAMEILNDLIDDRCRTYGVFNTISYLIEYLSCSKEELLFLKFDEKDIDYVFAHPDEDYDDPDDEYDDDDVVEFGEDEIQPFYEEDLEDILEWFGDHDQATEDLLDYCEAEDLEDCKFDDVVDWLDMHAQAYDDCYRYVHG